MADAGGRLVPPVIARRLAVMRQRLAGPPPATDRAGILALVRELGCLQLDPISAVARSHLLVLFSRLGGYEAAHLETLLYEERQLFEYWAHCASIVPTADYPLHRRMMDDYGTGASAAAVRMRAWLTENEALRRQIMDRLRAEGPLPATAFEGQAMAEWISTGWTSGRTVSRMLDYLWIKGEIMVAGRQGIQKRWDLAERCLPAALGRASLDERELVRQALQRSLRSLGIATPAQMRQHFIRGRYPGQATVIADLVREGLLVPVAIGDERRRWPGQWYLHAADLPVLESLLAGDWQPRTTLLSPFDNLICDRRRTEQLFNFEFRIEIYVPAARRQYGYYVLPILHGDQLIGRIDPVMDRRSRRLVINAIYAEPDAPRSSATEQAVQGAIEHLAEFLGARAIDYAPAAQGGWAGAQRAG